MARSFAPFILLSLVLTIVAGGREKEEPNSDLTELGPQRLTALRKLIDESTHWFEIRKSEESATRMKPVVVMRWPNAPRGSPDGATVIWLADGIPHAVAAIYPWEGKLFVHEFDSLSHGTIVATREGKLVWSPEAAGLEFHAVADWPVPARSRAARLRQMKTLASQFSATLLGWNADDSQREQLRLVPRPLYRYDTSDPKEILDGALFAFATGTDPESILVIEAVRVQGELQWQYAFVRQSSGKLEARFRGSLVWSADRFPEKHNPRSTHIEFSRPLNEVLPVEN